MKGRSGDTPRATTWRLAAGLALASLCGCSLALPGSMPAGLASDAISLDLSPGVSSASGAAQRIEAAAFLVRVAGVLRGRAVFPGYMVQANIADVAVAATVSLIDPALNETRATTVTDDQGGFTLNLAGFIPGGEPYYLEAVKGLPSGQTSNAVGKDAARVRTLVQFAGGSWRNLTTERAIVISRATTALSAIVSLRQSSAPVDLASLLGTLTLSGGNTTFNEAGTGVGQTEFATVLDLVTSALVADHDPLEGLLYGGGSYDLKPGIVQDVRPFIHKVDPPLAAVGQRVVIRGTGFGERRGDVEIRFSPAVAAPLATASATELWVTVPSGAQTGEIQVSVGGKSTSAPFTLMPELTGGFKP